MALSTLYNRFRQWLCQRARAAQATTDEREFTEELERLDREQPGWDRRSRVAGCIAALMGGMHRAMAAQIYGADILHEAEQAIWHDKHKKQE